MRLDSGLSLRVGSWFARAVAAPTSTLLNGLVSYWPLDEVSGTRADAVGDNDLTDNNTVGVGYRGPSGTVAKFVAANSEGLTASSTDFQKASSDWAFAGWFRIDTYAVYDPIFGTWAANQGFGVFQGGSTPLPGGNGALVYQGAEELFAATDAPLLGQGTWNFIAVSFDVTAGELSVSTNGAAYVTKSPASPTSRTSNFWVGTQPAPQSSDITHGPIGCWTRKLSISDVQALFNSGNGKRYADLTTAEKVNLVSYWDLDEASGNRADSHGSNTLTDSADGVGSATNSGGAMHNAAASFVAANSEYLSLGADITSDITTVSLWVKPASLPDFATVFISSGDNGIYTTADLLLQGRASGNLEYYIHNTNVNMAVTGALSIGNWSHIIAEHDKTGANARIWINNGTVTQTESYTGTPVSPQTKMLLGGTAVAYDGLIDEVAIWSRVLTEDERAELYASGAGVYYNGSDFV